MVYHLRLLLLLVLALVLAFFLCRSARRLFFFLALLLLTPSLLLLLLRSLFVLLEILLNFLLRFSHKSCQSKAKPTAVTSFTRWKRKQSSACAPQRNHVQMGMCTHARGMRALPSFWNRHSGALSCGRWSFGVSTPESGSTPVSRPCVYSSNHSIASAISCFLSCQHTEATTDCMSARQKDNVQVCVVCDARDLPKAEQAFEHGLGAVRMVHAQRPAQRAVHSHSVLDSVLSSVARPTARRASAVHRTAHGEWLRSTALPENGSTHSTDDYPQDSCGMHT